MVAGLIGLLEVIGLVGLITVGYAIGCALLLLYGSAPLTERAAVLTDALFVLTAPFILGSLLLSAEINYP